MIIKEINKHRSPMIRVEPPGLERVTDIYIGRLQIIECRVIHGI